jgi:TP901 family phage tail tape measure protein
MANPLALVWDLIARDAASPAFLATAASADKAAAATERATVSTREASVAAEKGSGAFLGLGKGILAIGAAIGIIDIGKHMVESAAKFQSDMLLIQTQAGGTAADVKKLSAAVLDLAGPTGTAPDKLALSMYHAFSVTKNMAKSLDIVKIAAEGAKVGHSDLEQTTNALTAAVASGMKGTQDYTQAMGALNAIVGAGDMKMSDLNEAMSTGLLVTVKQYGVTLNDVGAALADFGDNNIRGAEAATRIRMAVQAFAAPMKAGKDAFASLHLSMTQLGTDMRTGGLNKALTDLRDHLTAAGDTGAKAGQILTEMFGKKAGAGVLVLNGTFDRFEQKVKQVKDGAGTFGDAWKATTETMSFQWDRVKAELDAFGIKAGTVLLPILNKAATFVGNGLQTVGSDIGQAATSAPAKDVYAGVQQAAKQVAAWFVAHRGDFARIFDDMKVAAADVIGWLKAHKPMFVEIFNTIKKDIGEAVDTFEHYYSMIGQIVSDIGQWMDTHKKQIHDTMADVDKTLRAIGSAWQSEFEAIRAVVETAIKIILNLWARFGKQILQHLETSFNSALQILRGAFEIMKGIFDVITGVLTGKWSKAWKGIEEIFGGVWDVIVGLLKSALNTISTFIGLFVAVFTAAWDLLWHAVQTAFFDAWKPITEFFKYIWANIVGAFKDAKHWLVQIGKDIIGGAWDGIKTAWNDVYGWFADLAKMINSAIGNLDNLLYNIGHAILEGLLHGMQAAWKDVTGFISGIGSWISSHKGPIDVDRKLLIPHGLAIMAGLNEGLLTGFAGVQSNVNGMTSKIGGKPGGVRSGVTIVNNNYQQPGQDMGSFAAVVSRTTARSMR